ISISYSTGKVMKVPCTLVMTIRIDAPRANWKPPPGDTMPGLPIFSVLPSGAALPLVTAAVSGETEVPVLPQATTTARAAVQTPSTIFLVIERSPDPGDGRGR